MISNTRRRGLMAACALMAALVVAPSVQAQQKSPTLGEAMDFVVEKLKTHARKPGLRDGKPGDHITYANITYAQGMLRFREVDQLGADDDEDKCFHFADIEVKLRDIDLDSIGPPRRERPDSPATAYSEFAILAVKGESFTKWYSISYLPDKKPTKRTASGFTLYFEEEPMAERVAKAFRHAVKLAKEEFKEPF